MKSRAALIIGIGKGHPVSESDESEESEDQPDEEAVREAAQQLIDAVHAKDVDGVVEALHAAHLACNMGGGDKE